MVGKLLFKNYLKSTIFLERFGGDTNIAVIVLFSILLISKFLTWFFFFNFLNKVFKKELCLKTNAQLINFETKNIKPKIALDCYGGVSVTSEVLISMLWPGATLSKQFAGLGPLFPNV